MEDPIIQKVRDNRMKFDESMHGIGSNIKKYLELKEIDLKKMGYHYCDLSDIRKIKKKAL